MVWFASILSFRRDDWKVKSDAILWVSRERWSTDCAFRANLLAMYVGKFCKHCETTAYYLHLAQNQSTTAKLKLLHFRNHKCLSTDSSGSSLDACIDPKPRSFVPILAHKQGIDGLLYDFMHSIRHISEY